MKCSQCGFDIKEASKPCPECGHVITEQEDLDKIIHDLLEEDTFEPTFQEESEEKKEEKPKKHKNRKLPKFNLPKVTTSTEKVVPKTQTKATPISLMKGDEKDSAGEMVVIGLRFFLVAVIGLFTLSLYFSWFTLNGNGVNQGYIRTEENQEYLHSAVRELDVDVVEAMLTQSEANDIPIVVFSGMDLYKFAKVNEDTYKTITGPSGLESLSLASAIQRYYMLAMYAVIFVNILSIGIVLLARRLKGITIVRNLSMLNFVIIGLNYLAIKVTFFSMIAIKAKDLLSQSVEHPEISMTAKGIAMDQSFYPYAVFELKGFYFSVIVLAVWLFVGIILSEVKHRRDEIAIEKGEL